ncbi:hypothetical protein [uncultured Thiodictyon sp.]|uniref:hypothetical protein n=1 Tax=uncultured Thiodictyon sp. TaxID=1846217 RepID=UPI0025EA7BA1|nr:hypothetical protein [uncultured Thiodictyon sp.]
MATRKHPLGPDYLQPRKRGCHAKAQSGLDRLSRAVIRERRRRYLGLPSLVVLTLLAWVLSGWFAWDGVRRGTLMAGVAAEAAATFVTGSAGRARPLPDQ